MLEQGLYGALAGILLATAYVQPAAQRSSQVERNRLRRQPQADRTPSDHANHRDGVGAVHDALNAITPRYAAYYTKVPGRGCSPDAAVAAAAYTVLVGVIPSFGRLPEAEALARAETPTRRR
jgi:hypothetical protein